MVPTSTQPTALLKRSARWQLCRSYRWRLLRRNQIGLIGLCLIVLISLSAVLAGFIAPYDPIKPDYAKRLVPPSVQHMLGTDELGRDLLSRLLYGARTSLVIGLVAEGFALAVGIALGTIAGWYGGWVDDVIMRVADIFFAIPGLMFLIVWVSIFESTPFSLFLGLGLIAWPGNARLMRSQVLAVKEQDYIVAARAIGASTLHIWQQHLVPNAIIPMIVIAPLGVAGVILNESILSFLVLQPQLRRQKGQTATIVGLFGSKLVLPPPERPSQDKGGQGSELPQQAP